jgi:hypothetical protein
MDYPLAGLIAVGLGILSSIGIFFWHITKPLREDKEINSGPERRVNRDEERRINDLLAYLLAYREGIEAERGQNIGYKVKDTLERVLEGFNKSAVDPIDFSVLRNKKKKNLQEIIKQLDLFN